MSYNKHCTNEGIRERGGARHSFHTAIIALPPGLPGGSEVKNPPANAEDTGTIPKSGRPPGERNGNPPQYSSWKIQWMEEPGMLQSMGSQRVRHDCVT